MNRAYELAQAEVGTYEWAGADHNPKVIAYFKDAGHGWVKDDETAWCAAFVGAMLHRAGLPGTGKLTARSYLEWGEPVPLEDAQPGDVVVFKRGNSSWQGHVAFFVRENPTTLGVLGGNQANQVNVKNYSKSALLGIRRAPIWNEPGDWPSAPVRDWDALDEWSTVGRETWPSEPVGRERDGWGPVPDPKPRPAKLGWFARLLAWLGWVR